MSRWSRRTQTGLWAAAVATSVAPDVVGLVRSLFGATSSYRWVTGGVFSLSQCQAWQHWWDVASLPGYQRLSTMPYLVVVPAFLLWLVTRRRRAVGWVAVGILGPIALVEPAFFGYDLARWGQPCTEMWLEPFPGRTIASWAYLLVPFLLILAATYRPGVRAVRVVTSALVVGSALCVAGDQRPPNPALESAADCRLPGERPPAIERLSLRQRRTAYICSVRGYPSLTAFREGRATDSVSDGVLLEQGRRACRGEKPMSLGGSRVLGLFHPSLEQLAFLCPETAAVQIRDREQRARAEQVEYERQEKAIRAYCERSVPKGPRPVKQGTEVVSGGESGSYSVGSGDDGSSFDKALDDGLVTGAGGAATVITGTQGNLCLTVRAYREPPPLALGGWERVAEVGFESADGKSGVESAWEPIELPSLTVSGPGSYRLRVYVRGRNKPETFWPEMPAERHLLVVFPGKSEKQKLLKNDER